MLHVFLRKRSEKLSKSRRCSVWGPANSHQRGPARPRRGGRPTFRLPVEGGAQTGLVGRRVRRRPAPGGPRPSPPKVRIDLHLPVGRCAGRAPTSLRGHRVRARPPAPPGRNRPRRWAPGPGAPGTPGDPSAPRTPWDDRSGARPRSRRTRAAAAHPPQGEGRPRPTPRSRLPVRPAGGGPGSAGTGPRNGAKVTLGGTRECRRRPLAGPGRQVLSVGELLHAPWRYGTGPAPRPGGRSPRAAQGERVSGLPTGRGSSPRRLRSVPRSAR